MSFVRATIESFCDVGSGTTPSRAEADRYYGGSIPWVKSGELRETIITKTEEMITPEALSETSLKLVPKGAVLVAMYGATVGRVGMLGIDATTNQAVCHVVPNASQADSRFVFHALCARLPEFVSKRVGGAQPNISQQIIRKTVIPLPPLDEQRRIAAILDAADTLRAKRRDALAKLDTLAQSIFIEMFGDPVANERSWKEVAVSDFVAGFASGKNLVASDEENGESEFRVLKVSAVTSLEYRPDECKSLPEGYTPPSGHFVRSGDLLFSRANTSDLVGATAFVYDTPVNIVLPDKIWRFVWHEEPRVDPHFVWFLFRHHAFRYEIAKRATGTSGSMKNISQEKVLSICVGLPPLDLQRRFAQEVRRIRQSTQVAQTSLIQLDRLFVSLQHHAFHGEL